MLGELLQWSPDTHSLGCMHGDAAVAVVWAAGPAAVQLSCELGAPAQVRHSIPGSRRVRIGPSRDCGCGSMQ